MGLLLYTLSVRLFWLLIGVGSLFNTKAKKFISGRRGWKNIKIPDKPGKRVWVHAASLGEFEQGRPIIEAIKRDYPDTQILVSFFSPSGFEVRKNYDLADLVVYLPLDTAGNARYFYQKFQPDIVCFIKYEFWYYFLREGFKRDIPIYLISGIFRNGQIFFKPWGGLYRKLLGYFNHIFVQNDHSYQLLNSIGYSNIELSGDTRFDRVLEIQSQKKEVEHISRFKKDSKLMVIGSAWEDDMSIIAPLINLGLQNLKFIIAPHEIDHSFIKKITSKLTGDFIRYSEINSDDPLDCDIMIIDNIGMLSSLYGYGEIAYVGGAFGKGLNNTLEAAVYGIPVFFGNKNYQKYQEAMDLMQKGGALPVGTKDELRKKVQELISSHELLTNRGKASRNYVVENAGATKKIMKLIQKNLDA